MELCKITIKKTVTDMDIANNWVNAVLEGTKSMSEPDKIVIEIKDEKD